MSDEMNKRAKRLEEERQTKVVEVEMNLASKELKEVVERWMIRADEACVVAPDDARLYKGAHLGVVLFLLRLLEEGVDDFTRGLAVDVKTSFDGARVRESGAALASKIVVARG